MLRKKEGGPYKPPVVVVVNRGAINKGTINSMLGHPVKGPVKHIDFIERVYSQ